MLRVRKSYRIFNPLLLGNEYVLFLAEYAHILKLDQHASPGAIAHCFFEAVTFMLRPRSELSAVTIVVAFLCIFLRPHGALSPTFVEQLILYVTNSNF